MAPVTPTLNPINADKILLAICSHVLLEDWTVSGLRPDVLYSLGHSHSIANRLTHYGFWCAGTIIVVDRILCGTDVSGRVGDGQIAGRQ